MGHGDEEQGASAEDKQGEGGTGAGEGPGVVVFDPDGLIAVDHTLDGLAHDLDGDDDAEPCAPKQKEWAAVKSRLCCMASRFNIE